MKKLTALILLGAVALLGSMATPALAEDAPADSRPVLTAIAFKNAAVNEPFSPTENEYTLTLDDPTATPTLKSYAIEGDAELFVTYVLDDAKHQTGVTVTLEYENGTNIYTFGFANAKTYTESANNYLAEVQCRLGEVYPALSEKTTDYRLYIPSDMTLLQLTVVTQDVGAYCDLPQQIEVAAGQEPTISATVIASNGESRQYNFKLTRLDKTTEEVKAALASPDFETLVKGELFYQKPAFLVTVGAVGGGLVLLWLFLLLAKRLTVKTEDADEVPFFAPAEE